MKVFTTTPEIKVIIRRPLDREGYIFSPEYLKYVSSSRGLTGNGSMTLEIANLKDYYLKSEAGIPKSFTYDEIFQNQTVIELQVKTKNMKKFRQLNIAYIESVSQSISSQAQSSKTITMPTLEKKVATSSLFIDLKEEGVPTAGTGNVRQTIELAIAGLAGVVKDIKNFQVLAKTLWNEVIYKLMQVDAVIDNNFPQEIVFGGKFLLREFQNEGNDHLLNIEISKKGITEYFIHILQNFQQMTFGQSISFWQMLQSLITEPFYELFYDPLETVTDEEVKAYVSSDESTTYKVPQGKGKVIVRKTPFDKLFDSSGKWVQPTPGSQDFYSFEADEVTGMSRSVASSEVYSGVHVGLTIMQEASVLIVPVKWNSILRGIYGFKVLQINLQGVGFTADASESERSQFTETIRSLRNRIYDIFLNHKELKNINGSFKKQFGFYRPGIPFTIDKSPQTDGIVGYITEVVDEFNPAEGKALTTINYKWGQVKN